MKETMQIITDNIELLWLFVSATIICQLYFD